MDDAGQQLQSLVLVGKEVGSEEVPALARSRESVRACDTELFSKQNQSILTFSLPTIKPPNTLNS